MEKDIIIVGAGAAGLSLACSLSNTNLKILLIEKQPIENIINPEYDGREIALTHFSKKILTELNIWKRFPANQISLIKEAKVLDGNSPYALHFDRKKVSSDALGYLVSNHIIRKALYEEIITKKNIEIISNSSVSKIKTNEKSATIKLNNKEIKSQLIVAADSRFSKARTEMGISASLQDFGRVAIVCKMNLSKNHHNIAYECFRYGETLALLPLVNNSASIVMTVPYQNSEKIMKLKNDEFNNFITNKFNNKFGKMKLSKKRHHYSLVGVYADKFVSNRFALIGDAAVGMHPVTAHGYNLGLRGQNTLYKHIQNALLNGLDYSSSIILEKYQSNHRKDSKALYLGTNAIVKLYTDDSSISKILRKTVLRIGNNISPFKKQIINQLTEIN